MLSNLKAAIVVGDKEKIEKEIKELANEYSLSVGNILSARSVYNRTASEWAELAQEMIKSAEKNQVDGKPDRVGVSMSLVCASWVVRALDKSEERNDDLTRKEKMKVEQLSIFEVM